MFIFRIFRKIRRTIRITIVLIIAAIIFQVAGCGNTSQASASQSGNPFVMIFTDSSIRIYVDKETKVEYITRNDGGSSYTELVNADNTPKLYTGEIN